MNEIVVHTLEIGELLSLGVLVGSFVSLILSFLGDLYGREKFAIISRLISTVSFFFLFLGVESRTRGMRTRG